MITFLLMLPTYTKYISLILISINVVGMILEEFDRKVTVFIQDIPIRISTKHMHLLQLRENI